MTENEVKETKEWLQDFIRMFSCNFDGLETRGFNECVMFLKELEQYRAIGTVEEFKAMMSENFTKDLLNVGYAKGIKDGYTKAIDEFASRLHLKVIAEIYDCAEELEWIEEIAEQLKEGEK